MKPEYKKIHLSDVPLLDDSSERAHRELIGLYQWQSGYDDSVDRPDHGYHRDPLRRFDSEDRSGIGITEEGPD